MRHFSGGATRDDGENKPEFDACLSPIVLRRFGTFMLKHNTQADGKKRRMDNWKSGIPRKVYLESMFRHFVDVWEHTTEMKDLENDFLEDALCAMLFNVQGLLREVLLGRDMGVEDGSNVTDRPCAVVLADGNAEDR